MIHIEDFIKSISKNEPIWAKHIEPILILARGVPSRSRTLGRWAYCGAGIGNDGQWFRLYPLPIENGNRLLSPFDIIKPFILKKHENGRPESCRINSWLVWKAGAVPDPERQSVLERILKPGFFLHDDSWHNKTLGLIKPKSFQVNIQEKRKPTITYMCDYQKCGGHTATFFDVLKIEARLRKLIAPAQELINIFLQCDQEKFWFIVGTLRKHPQRWIVVEVLVSLDKTVIALQSWLMSKIKRNAVFA